MKKIVLFVVFVILLLILILIGSRKSIVGEWELINSDDELIYFFHKDHTCSYESIGARLDCTYKLEKNHIIIHFNGNVSDNIYQYQLNKDQLIIEDDKSKQYTFQKIDNIK